MRIHIDYETRSKCDLRKHGAWLYSRDPSTSVLCISYAFGDEEPKISHPAFPGIPAVNWPPKDLLKVVEDRSNTVHAHNAFFERSIWLNVCAKRYGWPEIKPDQWRCTLSVCAYKSLPRSLEDVAKFLQLPFKKDMAGNKAMLICSKPKEDGSWHLVKADLERTFSYCINDVRVERAVENTLGVLPDYEQKIWVLDQIMNERGIAFDRNFAEEAIKIADIEKDKANIDLYDLTGGMVASTKARKTFAEWTKAQGFDLTGVSLAADKLDLILSNPKVPDIIKEAIDIKSSVSASSVAKYKAVLNYIDIDDRVRDGLRYFGAATGRWAGKGVQVQNFTRGYGAADKRKPYGISMAVVVEPIRRGQVWEASFITGERPMSILKKATRGLVVAAPGHEMLIADYSSVEARGVMWLADDEDGLSALRAGDIYCSMASAVYGYEVNKKDHPQQRQLGKAIILGCGYQMGYSKFLMTAEKDGIRLSDELVRNLLGDRFEEYKKEIIADAPGLVKAGWNVKEKGIALMGAKFLVDSYREKYKKVKELWKSVEVTAIEAMKNPGERIQCGKISWEFDPLADFLYCYLPSGRCINYPGPTLSTAYTLSFTALNKKGKQVRAKVQVDRLDGNEAHDLYVNLIAKGYKVDSPEPQVWATDKLKYLKAGVAGMRSTATYGGKLVENIVQGLCRDLMAEAMLRAEEHKYNPIATIHDEIIGETKIGEKSIHDFEKLLCEVPEWGLGFPIAAEGFTTVRYHK